MSLCLLLSMFSFTCLLVCLPAFVTVYFCVRVSAFLFDRLVRQRCVLPGSSALPLTLHCTLLCITVCNPPPPPPPSPPFPRWQVKDPSARVEHEASTSKIGEDQLFYFQQRGIDAEKAVGMIISGFCREVFNELPLEFASEVNQLMSLKLEGSVG